MGDIGEQLLALAFVGFDRAAGRGQMLGHGIEPARQTSDFVARAVVDPDAEVATRHLRRQRLRRTSTRTMMRPTTREAASAIGRERSNARDDSDGGPPGGRAGRSTAISPTTAPPQVAGSRA